MNLIFLGHGIKSQFLKNCGKQFDGCLFKHFGSMGGVAMGMVRFSSLQRVVPSGTTCSLSQAGQSCVQQSFSLDVETVTHRIMIPSFPLKSPCSFDLEAGAEFWTCFLQPWPLCTCPHPRAWCISYSPRCSAFAVGAEVSPEQGAPCPTCFTVGVNFLLQKCWHLCERHCFHFLWLCPSNRCLLPFLSLLRIKMVPSPLEIRL